MSSKLKIILGFHCHFPLAPGAEEFGRFYERKLRPFLRAVHQFPRAPVTLHFSGSLLHRIERGHGECLTLLWELASRRKQIELLSGGFYEPMLSLASRRDRAGQIELLTAFLRRSFGRRATGCFLPPESWDIDLVGALDNAGMRYTFLPDSMFVGTRIRNAGELYRPYITEDEGKTLVIFPVIGGFDSAALARGGVEAEIDMLLANAPPAAEGAEPVAAFFPRMDADFESEARAEELFCGLFRALEARKDRVEMTHPAKVYKSLASLPDIYIRANNIKQYFAGHPESARIYYRIVWTRNLIDQIRGDKARKAAALKTLWKAQDYGLFCGTARDGHGMAADPQARGGAYRHILEAEKTAAQAVKKRPRHSLLTEEDVNFDGEIEYIFQGRVLDCFVRRRGAAVFELDFLAKPENKAWNYLSTYSPPEDGAERLAFMDMLASGEDGFFADCRDCSKERYDVTEVDRKRGKLVFTLKSRPPGSVPFAAISIIKEYRLEENTLGARWTFINEGEAPERFYFIPEINLSFPRDDEAGLRVYAYPAGGADGEKHPAPRGGMLKKDLRAIEFQDTETEAAVRLSSGGRFDARYFPAASKDAASSKRRGGVYQATCVRPGVRVELESGARREVAYDLSVYYNEI